MAVRAGDWVLLSTSEEKYIFVEARANEKFRMGRERVDAGGLIGAAFGTRFEVRRGHLVKESKKPKYEVMRRDEESAQKRRPDNRDMIDNNQAQTLGSEAIESMRKSGASGEDIISALVSGSETWDQKTEFAQAKYLKRKAKKYLPWIRIIEPTAATVSRAFYERAHNAKYIVLRPDALAALLSRANLRSGLDLICVDGTGGILLAGVLERLGDPEICRSRAFLPCLNSSQQRSSPPPIDALRRMNWPKSRIDSSILPFKFIPNQDTANTISELPTDAEPRALIIASKHNPISVLTALLPLLLPSSAFAIYCDYLEPLARCFRDLQRRSNPSLPPTVNLLLSETWLRHFQVLPNRTHPDMTMSATGGYLLSGTVLAASSSLPPATATEQVKQIE